MGKSSENIPIGYKSIRVHFVFVVKHDGLHKELLVEDGHSKPVTNTDVYSLVVSLRGPRMVFFISDINGIKILSTDIGNTYLESKTEEKVYVEAGQ